MTDSRPALVFQHIHMLETLVPNSVVTVETSEDLLEVELSTHCAGYRACAIAEASARPAELGGRWRVVDGLVLTATVVALEHRATGARA